MRKEANGHGRKTVAVLGRAARQTVKGAEKAGVRSYDRSRDLPGLIRLDPFAPVPTTQKDVEAILTRLTAALRAERNRARSGHWTYDLNRHIALRQAYLAEAERLQSMKDGGL